MESRFTATKMLGRIVNEKLNLDGLLDPGQGNAHFLKLSPQDRGLVRAILVTALRHRRAIEVLLGKMMDRKPPKGLQFFSDTLHIAAVQILFLDLPDRAAVDLAVTAIGNDRRSGRYRGLANAVLRRLSREKDELLKEASISPFPDWFEQRLRRDYGREKVAEIAQRVMLEPFVDITVKSNAEAWASKLGGKVISPSTVRLIEKASIESLEGYETGEWWVQDAAAALPAKLIPEGPNLRVLDLCAAPGGKTAQLANAGHTVTALDASENRLKRLKANLDRLKLSAEIVCADMMEWEPTQQFDAVLLDSPCSSTGTIRRHPDIMWTKSDKDVSDLARLQFDMLNRARIFVKPGGTLVFSNCSIFKEEGESLLAKALKTFEDFDLSPIDADELPHLDGVINGQGALRTLPLHLPAEPAEHGGLDGFFTCRLVKK